MKRKVLVIGSGAAGLAAATRLLELAPDRLEVKLVHQGHHFGGKASSTRTSSGRFIEHGWHMVVGFYDRLRALVRRAGVNDGDVFLSMGGQSHPFESWSQRIHTLDGSGDSVDFAGRFLSYDGLPIADRGNYGWFMGQAMLAARGTQDLTRHDDLCFDTFAIEHGMRPHLTKYSVFRFLREAYFNFPEQISAYHVLQSMRLMSTPARAESFVCKGPWSEVVWEPIARYFLALGGTVEPFTLATDWVWDGTRITGVRVARPDSAGHGEGTRPWEPAVRGLPGTERTLSGFDFVVSTIPHAVFVKMNRSEERMWRSPYFKRLLNLRSGATVSMTLTTREPVLEFPGPIFGFPAPLGIAVNMKPYWEEYRNDPKAGSVLDFVGQEAGFEGWSDSEIASATLDNFSRAYGVGDLRAAGVGEVELHRNRSDSERLLLCEPGVNQFRPGPRTPFDNLFLAGDWVRNEVDLICMEGAVASGHNAAAEVVSRL
ncbi:MAG: hypothetical protein H6Q89_2198 [Myxococcaceae bacterium]|nr:hypothetical protein [Myxococcaceae bacterium]